MEMTDQVSRKRMMSSDDSLLSFLTALEAMDEHLNRREFEMFERAESLLGFNNDEAKRLRSIRKETESLGVAISNQTAIFREKLMKKENKPLGKKKILDIQIDELLKRTDLELLDDVEPLLITAAPLPPGLAAPVARGPPTLVSPTLTGLVPPATTGLATLSEQGTAPIPPSSVTLVDCEDSKANSVSLEKTGGSLDIHFRCPCGKSYHCFYKLT